MSAQVLAAVRELLPAIRERADQAEQQRRVPSETIKELDQAGMFALLRPKRYNGYESNPMDFYTAVREIGSACGSTGWVASVVGIHAWQLSLFPAKAQQEVWGEDPSTRISSSYAPTGQVSRVEGGYRLSGRWSFSSGCDHAQWVFLGGMVPGDDGKPVDMCTFLLPNTDYRIDDVWDTIGLRGTGSNDILVEDVFVPTHRVLSFADCSVLRCPGHEVNTSPLYRMPFAAVFSNSITAPIIGMATGAYDHHVEWMRERVRISYGQKAAEDSFAHVRLADAGSEIDAAWGQLERNIGELMSYANAGEDPPQDLRLRVRRDQVRGTERAIQAIDRLFENSGGKALKVGNPIQRFWRDAHGGRVHAVNDPERAKTMFGAGEFGLDIQDPMI